MPRPRAFGAFVDTGTAPLAWFEAERPAHDPARIARPAIFFVFAGPWPVDNRRVLPVKGLCDTAAWLLFLGWNLPSWTESTGKTTVGRPKIAFLIRNLEPD